MANTKEIKSRIHSVQDTMKITKAMHMISSSKLKKAKKEMKDSQEHFKALQKSIAKIFRNVPDIENEYLGHKRVEQKKVGYLVVTADKGLAGAYNHNVLKLTQKELNANPDATLLLVGQVGRSYFGKRGYTIDRFFHHTAQNPSIHKARVICEEILLRYNAKELDEVYMVYTSEINGLEDEAKIQKLLPLSKADFKTDETEEGGRVATYLPSPDDVLNSIVPNYVTGFVFGALTMSYACEQNDRMMAMDAATKNAKDMLATLSVEYNRVRQAAITQEITEVIAGAKAQKRKKKANE